MLNNEISLDNDLSLRYFLEERIYRIYDKNIFTNCILDKATVQGVMDEFENDKISNKEMVKQLTKLALSEIKYRHSF